MEDQVRKKYWHCDSGSLHDLIFLSLSAKFEPFLKSYYDKFKYESIDSFEFKAYLLAYFKDEPKMSEIDWDQWFNTPGMPKYKPNYDDSLAKVHLACCTTRSMI